MHAKLESLISWISLPVYAWQGLALRKNSLRLPPPANQVIEPAEGTGAPYRLLLIGDSSAAGVGVKDIKLSLGGQLQEIISTQSGRPTSILIAGCNSATSGQIRDHTLPHIEQRDFTHVVLNIGTNDAKNFHTGKRFCREFGTLLYALNTRFPDAKIIWSSILDLSTIPSLPSPLNNIMGIRSRELARRGEILCHERRAEIPEGEWDPSVENFSHDGFHASEKGYNEWASLLAAHILKSE